MDGAAPDEYGALRWLTGLLVFHDALAGSRVACDPGILERIPVHKRLEGCTAGCGLPLGNLTSQFFGNVYLDALDQHAKHALGARRYLRYVDDIVMVSEDPDELQEWLEGISRYLRNVLRLEINERRTRLRPVGDGVDFLGYVVHPDHRLVRRRVVGHMRRMLRESERRLVSRVRLPGCASGGCRFTLARYPLDTLEKLGDSLGSYLAVLEKADTGRLLANLIERHSWLGEYFDIQGYRLARRYRPPRSSRGGLASQRAWFASMHPGCAVLMQVGTHFELYDDDATALGPGLGLRAIRPRPGFARRRGFHVRLLPSRIGISLPQIARWASMAPSVPCNGTHEAGWERVAARLLAAGLPVVVAIETGARLERLAERRAVLCIRPGPR